MRFSKTIVAPLEAIRHGPGSSRRLKDNLTEIALSRRQTTGSKCIGVTKVSRRDEVRLQRTRTDRIQKPSASRWAGMSEALGPGICVSKSDQ